MKQLQVVCAVIRDQQGLYLICRRPEGKAHAGLWEFPGGKVEEGEGEQGALCREIQEELGCAIEIKTRLSPVSDASRSIFLIPFLCSLQIDAIKLQEHTDYAWVSIDQILEYNLAEADVKIAQNLMN